MEFSLRNFELLIGTISSIDDYQTPHVIYAGPVTPAPTPSPSPTPPPPPTPSPAPPPGPEP